MRRLYRFILCLFGLVGILHLFRALSRFRVLRLDPIPFAPQYDAIYLAGRKTNHLEPIELFTVINGACAANRAVVSLKSMLYFQGRYKTASKRCPSTVNRPPGIVCRNQSVEPYRPVRLHWVADVAARDRIIYIFDEWHPSDVHIYLYNYERFVVRMRIRADFVDPESRTGGGCRKLWECVRQLFQLIRTTGPASYVGAIPIKHYAGVPAMYKILVPYILPEEVTKVIVLDSDVLFNHNVLDLWKEFGLFKPQQVRVSGLPILLGSKSHWTQLTHLNNSQSRPAKLLSVKQVFGAACEQITYCPHSCSGDDTNIPKVLNEIMRRNITLYYPLRCEWNVQLFKADGMQCCPIQWVDRLPHETHCINPLRNANSREPARLVHYNIQRKPEGCGQYAPSSMDFQAGLAEMSLEQIRHRYFQVHHKFRTMPTECFEIP
ncbi:hypothetical protein T265_12829 [Opisthorchis viverrini]|uniref:Glycosyltransferase, family 8 n=1 Tax=Opisthorchis viverrini TaxID=6198 RepID=A0A075AIU7_OPIVI|nr:hypothetical protein T265_12829 [Opisthorchis viverrini]KER32254.1 hypothetical protein T265_12829 [Opisthorchis viverrini]